MYTQIHLRRDGVNQPSPFYADLAEVCESGMPVAVYAGMQVSYSAYGISCQLDERIMRLPIQFRGLPVIHVTLVQPEWSESAPVTGTYDKRRATAVVSRATRRSGNHAAHAYQIIVQGSTLGAVNHLFDEIVTGQATPKVAYGKRGKG